MKLIRIALVIVGIVILSIDYFVIKGIVYAVAKEEMMYVITSLLLCGILVMCTGLGIMSFLFGIFGIGGIDR